MLILLTNRVSMKPLGAWLCAWLEYLRAFAWTPTDNTRTIKAYYIPLGHERGLRLVKEQRLYFGRWGKFKWRTEKRFFRIEAHDQPER